MSDIPHISVTDVPDEAIMLDVRETGEFAAGHAPGAVNIPLGVLPLRLADIPEHGGPLLVICKSGGRSAQAVRLLQEQGVEAVNVDGGHLAWAHAGKELLSETGEPPFVA